MCFTHKEWMDLPSSFGQSKVKRAEEGETGGTKDETSPQVEFCEDLRGGNSVKQEGQDLTDETLTENIRDSERRGESPDT